MAGNITYSAQHIKRAALTMRWVKSRKNERNCYTTTTLNNTALKGCALCVTEMNSGKHLLTVTKNGGVMLAIILKARKMDTALFEARGVIAEYCKLIN